MPHSPLDSRPCCSLAHFARAGGCGWRCASSPCRPGCPPSLRGWRMRPGSPMWHLSARRKTPPGPSRACSPLRTMATRRPPWPTRGTAPSACHSTTPRCCRRPVWPPWLCWTTAFPSNSLLHSFTHRGPSMSGPRRLRAHHPWWPDAALSPPVGRVVPSRTRRFFPLLHPLPGPGPDICRGRLHGPWHP